MNTETWAKEIPEIFKGNPENYDWRDIEVKITENPNSVTVRVSQMYEYLNFTFVELEKLSKLFGTSDFTVDQESHGGCETCDYGSSYTKEFTIPKADKR